MKPFRRPVCTLVALMPLVGAPAGYAQTEGMERRDNRRDTRQNARHAKRACKAGDEKTRAECRKEKRDTKQDARHGEPQPPATNEAK